jgi:hypothetical protein
MTQAESYMLLSIASDAHLVVAVHLGIAIDVALCWRHWQCGWLECSAIHAKFGTVARACLFKDIISFASRSFGFDSIHDDRIAAADQVASERVRAMRLRCASLRIILILLMMVMLFVVVVVVVDHQARVCMYGGSGDA